MFKKLSHIVFDISLFSGEKKNLSSRIKKSWKINFQFLYYFIKFFNTSRRENFSKSFFRSGHTLPMLTLPSQQAVHQPFTSHDLTSSSYRYSLSVALYSVKYLFKTSTIISQIPKNSGCNNPPPFATKNLLFKI